jgi:hypothetical protein
MRATRGSVAAAAVCSFAPRRKLLHLPGLRGKIAAQRACPARILRIPQIN